MIPKFCRLLIVFVMLLVGGETTWKKTNGCRVVRVALDVHQQRAVIRLFTDNGTQQAEGVAKHLCDDARDKQDKVLTLAFRNSVDSDQLLYYHVCFESDCDGWNDTEAYQNAAVAFATNGLLTNYTNNGTNVTIEFQSDNPAQVSDFNDTSTVTTAPNSSDRNTQSTHNASDKTTMSVRRQPLFMDGLLIKAIRAPKGNSTAVTGNTPTTRNTPTTHNTKTPLANHTRQSSKNTSPQPTNSTGKHNTQMTTKSESTSKGTTTDDDGGLPKWVWPVCGVVASLLIVVLVVVIVGCCVSRRLKKRQKQAHTGCSCQSCKHGDGSPCADEHLILPSARSKNKKPFGAKAATKPGVRQEPMMVAPSHLLTPSHKSPPPVLTPPQQNQGFLLTPAQTTAPILSPIPGHLKQPEASPKADNKGEDVPQKITKDDPAAAAQIDDNCDPTEKASEKSSSQTVSK